jgi:hypothetical protein
MGRLNQRQALLARQPHLVVTGGMHAEVQFGIADRAELARQARKVSLGSNAHTGIKDRPATPTGRQRVLLLERSTAQTPTADPPPRRRYVRRSVDRHEDGGG